MPEHPLLSPDEIERATSEAVAHYWITRIRQQERQRSSGKADQGARGAVTGGAQMDGFLEFFSRVIIGAGMEAESVFYRRALELPGFFRPTKDL